MNSPTGTSKVLIVDDDSLTLELVKRMLSRAGFTAATASSGEQALARLETDDFAAVVTDVVMPRMSGFELLRQIRVSCPWLPVILISSLDEEDIRDAAAIGGAFALFGKPLDRAALVAAIESAMLSSAEDAACAGQETRWIHHLPNIK